MPLQEIPAPYDAAWWTISFLYFIDLKVINLPDYDVPGFRAAIKQPLRRTLQLLNKAGQENSLFEGGRGMIGYGSIVAWTTINKALSFKAHLPAAAQRPSSKRECLCYYGFAILWNNFFNFPGRHSPVFIFFAEESKIFVLYDFLIRFV